MRSEDFLTNLLSNQTLMVILPGGRIGVRFSVKLNFRLMQQVREPVDAANGMLWWGAEWVS